MLLIFISKSYGKKTTENKVGALVSKQKSNNSLKKRKESWVFLLKGRDSQTSVLSSWL